MNSRLANKNAGTPNAAWWMLAFGMAAQTSSMILVSAPAFLIPILHEEWGMSLTEAGLLASAPPIGMVLTLVFWGVLADLYGERWVIAGGLSLTSVFVLLASATHNPVWLWIFLAIGSGAAASTNVASGRVVVGWFPHHRRGLAMGIRQMSQPFGVAIAALTVPPLAAHYGITGPLLLVACITLIVAGVCTIGIVDPLRATQSRKQITQGTQPSATNPYLHNNFLVRIHIVSVLLMLPQYALSTFGLVWLTLSLGWSAVMAGSVVAAAQCFGAFGRIVMGGLSDRLGTRVGILRWIAVASIAAMALVILVDSQQWTVAAGVIFILASTISMADNGLAFTSVAEAAGPTWLGKVLGFQNTGQFVAASVVGPGVGALITLFGYPIAFTLVAIGPLASIFIVPYRDHHWGEHSMK